MFIAALTLGWLGWRMRGIRSEARAAAEIEKSGANVWFHEYQAVPLPDRWLWRWFGHGPVKGVLLTGPEVTDDSLEHLKQFPRLQSLGVLSDRITDAGLDHLRTRTGLEDLSLIDTQITDAGLKHLRGLTNLQEVFLENGDITDDGLQHLKRLAALRRLVLNQARVSNEGVRNLQATLPKCEIRLGRPPPKQKTPTGSK